MHRYCIDFPDISIQDSVRLQFHLLRDHLHLFSITYVIGVSLGGMQVVEYAAQTRTGATPFVHSIVPIACGADHSAWQIAVGEAQRQAIYADPKWKGGNWSWRIRRMMG